MGAAARLGFEGCARSGRRAGSLAKAGDIGECRFRRLSSVAVQEAMSNDQPEASEMKSVNPYLNFPGNTEEAFDFYRAVFGGEFLSVIRFSDFGDNAMGVPDKDLDKIAHIALPIGTGLLMGTDTLESWGRPLTMGNNYYFALEPESGDEAERLFEALSAGGNAEMPLQPTEWAEKYGSCTDRFGVQWMVSYTGDVKFPAS
jgi:PhnB protein